VVQKHAARRLHWDFRLQHGDVLWSWAVPKGPSLDPADKRLAVHVEDHPLEYAAFQGRIAQGQYGAGTVETWDRGTWQPLGDPQAGLASGELKFRLVGGRLNGGFVLVRLKSRERERAENWLLIKEHDDDERPGGDATALEAAVSAKPKSAPRKRPGRKGAAAGAPPAAGAIRGPLPATQAPQFATTIEAPPDEAGWLSEVKFDGYRLLVRIGDGPVKLLTRSGQDWTRRLPATAALFAQVQPRQALIDGELVALRADGISSFHDLQAALSEGRDGRLFFQAFDLLHLDGWDLRPCRLADRKTVLRGLSGWQGRLRYSDHVEGQSGAMRRRACELGLEGIVCKRADAPYRAGRNSAWVKLKCQGREEFLVIGYTPPERSRVGLGALHLGFRDHKGALHYVGGVGTGFSDHELASLSRALDGLRAPPPNGLHYADTPPDRRIVWVRPELVAEVQYAAWSGAGRLRHATFLGLREDKPAAEILREVPDPTAERHALRAAAATRIVRPGQRIKERAMPTAPPRTVQATRAGRTELEGVSLSHPDRELWPGITKRDLAEYWLAVAPQALGGIAHRPLALVRCPEGIDGEHFFQKHGHQGFPAAIRSGEADDAPYLAIDAAAGLVAAAQVSAIELHAWGASETDPLHPDRLVFDLDPGEGVSFADVVSAAQQVRERLQRDGLEAFCRTTGGKGLHVVAPLRPQADWPRVREWCQGFARAMEADSPEHFVASVPKQRRRGRILVDWLRNGLGATAVASFSPRARPGAGVATPLAWREVTPTLDPARFTLATVPQRLAKHRSDPWADFAQAARSLPEAR
jgi:bifunctional non-homologous end joining protein LigD